MPARKKAWEYEDTLSSQPQAYRILHDSCFNNKKKIREEHAIAEGILSRPTDELLKCIAQLNTVTVSLIRYIEEHPEDDASKAMLELFQQHVGANSDQLGRYSDTSDLTNTNLLSWLKSVLTLEVRPNTEQLISMIRIHVATDYVIFDILQAKEAYRHVLNLLMETHVNCENQLKDEKFFNNELSRIATETYQHRGRIPRMHQGKSIVASETREYGLFPRSESSESISHARLPSHFRGMDAFRVKAFYQDAQKFSLFVANAIDKDIPLVCSISTTSLRVLRFVAAMTRASVMGYWHYALAHMSYNIISGHHTLHEAACIMRFVGIPYIDGHYPSVFPAGHPAKQIADISQQAVVSYDITESFERIPLFRAYLSLIEQTHVDLSFSSSATSTSTSSSIPSCSR